MYIYLQRVKQNILLKKSACSLIGTLAVLLQMDMWYRIANYALINDRRHFVSTKSNFHCNIKINVWHLVERIYRMFLRSMYKSEAHSIKIISKYSVWFCLWKYFIIDLNLFTPSQISVFVYNYSTNAAISHWNNTTTYCNTADIFPSRNVACNAGVILEHKCWMILCCCHLGQRSPRELERVKSNP